MFRNRCVAKVKPGGNCQGLSGKENVSKFIKNLKTEKWAKNPIFPQKLKNILKKSQKAAPKGWLHIEPQGWSPN